MRAGWVAQWLAQPRRVRAFAAVLMGLRLTPPEKKRLCPQPKKICICVMQESTNTCLKKEIAYVSSSSCPCSHFQPSSIPQFPHWEYLLPAHQVPQRAVQVLFSISLASAILVTTVSYGILVPSVLLLPQPPHRQGGIVILLSPQGHIMHSLNLAFMLCDMWLGRQTMQPRDLHFGAYWILAYTLFEWCFHSFTGMWHYPFMNYNKPFAPVAYAALYAVFVAYWLLGCRLSSYIHCRKVHSA